MKLIEQLKPVQYAIIKQLQIAMGNRAPIGLQAALGSWGDTLSEAEVLQMLTDWNKGVPLCCFIPDQANPTRSRCLKPAEWTIEFPPGGPDNYTESCTEHVGHMLTDSPSHVIHRITPVVDKHEAPSAVSVVDKPEAPSATP